MRKGKFVGQKALLKCIWVGVLGLIVAGCATANADGNPERIGLGLGLLPGSFSGWWMMPTQGLKMIGAASNADYIPILASVPSELFGVVVALRDGAVFGAGDVDYTFAIESVSKPFTAALVMQQYGGPQAIVEKIGVEPTGLPFNSKLAIEILDARSVNPLVNAGAHRFGEHGQGGQ